MAAPATRKGARARTAPSRSGRKGRPGPSRAATIVVFDVDKYGGKWVATRRGRVVASSDDLAGIRQAVRDLGIEEDSVLTRVPETGEFAY